MTPQTGGDKGDIQSGKDPSRRWLLAAAVTILFHPVYPLNCAASILKIYGAVLNINNNHMKPD
jgi:hypothetical protein